MINLLFLPALLVGAFLLVRGVGLVLGRSDMNSDFGGRAAMAVLLTFTGVAHFFKTSEMAEMVPGFFPHRELMVVITGVIEVAAAIGLLFRRWAPMVGKLLIVFFVAIFPANIYAAINHVEFGGHGQGPSYLIFRVPLQLFFIGWTWWFSLRATRKSVARNC